MEASEKVYLGEGAIRRNSDNLFFIGLVVRSFLDCGFSRAVLVLLHSHSEKVSLGWGPLVETEA
jgi:hypothetical protein